MLWFTVPWNDPNIFIKLSSGITLSVLSRRFHLLNVALSRVCDQQAWEFQNRLCHCQRFRVVMWSCKGSFVLASVQTTTINILLIAVNVLYTCRFHYQRPSFSFYHIIDIMYSCNGSVASFAIVNIYRLVDSLPYSLLDQIAIAVAIPELSL